MRVNEYSARTFCTPEKMLTCPKKPQTVVYIPNTLHAMGIMVSHDVARRLTARRSADRLAIFPLAVREAYASRHNGGPNQGSLILTGLRVKIG